MVETQLWLSLTTIIVPARSVVAASLRHKPRGIPDGDGVKTMLTNTAYPIDAVVLFLITSGVDALIFLLLMRPLLAIVPVIRFGPTASALEWLVDLHLDRFHRLIEGHFGRRLPVAVAWMTLIAALFGARYVLMLMAVEGPCRQTGVVF